MSWQWKWIDRFNAWYDGLEPVPRLFAFLAATVLAIVPLQLGLYLGNRETTVTGLAILILMAIVAMARSNTMGPRNAIIAKILTAMVILVGVATVILMFIDVEVK